MLRAIIISLLLLFTTYPQGNIWYVRSNASGANTGRNWDDAWTSISDSQNVSTGINYAILEGGDTVYVAAGDYNGVSGAYAHRIYPTYATYGLDGIVYDSTVVICPAKDTYIGDVNINANSNSSQWILQICNISNIKLTGFNFIDNRTATNGQMLYLGGSGADGYEFRDSLITIENCHIVGNALQSMLSISGYKTTLRDNIIEQIPNSLDTDQDPIGVNNGRGGHTIDGNTIIVRNDNVGTDSHRDIIQWSNFGIDSLDERVINTISNNLIIDTAQGGTSWTGLIYSSNPQTSVTWYVYNNILVSNKTATGVGAIILNQPDILSRWLQSVHILNNTIILNNGTGEVGTSNWITISNTSNIFTIDTIVIKNNLMVIDAPILLQALNLQPQVPTQGTYFREVDYNAYFESDGIHNDNFMSEGWGFLTYIKWQVGCLKPIEDCDTTATKIYDANSIDGLSANVTFIDKYDTNVVSYYTETGRDLGTDLSAEYPFLSTDILGNPRLGTWDIGALEFPTRFRNAVLLTHSSGSGLYDYEDYWQVDSGTVTTVPLEIDDYNTTNGYTGADTVSMAKRWYPSTVTEWVNWLLLFRNELEGNDVYAKLDTFNVVIIKGAIASTIMTGYGNAADTSAGYMDDKTVEVYKWIWRELVETMESYPETFWVIMTGSAAGDENNTLTGARLAHEFATWAKDTLAVGNDPVYGTFPENVYVFDYFHYLANDSTYYLKDEYESGYVETPPVQNDHPNATASNVIAPIFVQEVFDAAIAYEGTIPATPADTVPTFSFTPVTGATRSQTYTATAVFLNADSTFHVSTTTGASFKIGALGSYATTMVEADSGDTVYVQNTASGSYSTLNRETIVAGGVSANFDVTTEDEPVIPPNPSGVKLLKVSNGRIVKDSTGKIIKTR